MTNRSQKSGQRTAICHFSLVICHWSFTKSRSAYIRCLAERRTLMSPTTSTKKQWTVMVYMAGDNNLDPNGVEDLKEMKKAGSTEALTVAAKSARAAGTPTKRTSLTRRGKVSKNAVAS